MSKFIKNTRGVGIVLSYLNTFLNMITGLFLSSFLIAKLGDTEYGVYQTMSSFANYLVLLEFGTGTVMTRNILKCRNQNAPNEEIEKNISTILGVMWILSLVILLVSVAFYFSIGLIYKNSLTVEQISQGKSMFIFIAVFLIASFVAQTVRGIPLAYENYLFSSALSIVRILTRTILLIVLIISIRQAVIIAIIDAALNIGIAIFSYIFCNKKFKIKIRFTGFDKIILKSSMPMCMALFLQTVVNQANSTVGKFILGVMTSPENVTLYSVGLYIYSIFSSIATIPIGMYMPQVSKNVMSGMEGKELTKTLIQPCRLIVLVSGAILFGFIACGQSFVSILYGKDYIKAYFIAIILMCPMFINMSNSVIINVLDIKNKRLARSLIMMISTSFNILITIFAIKFYGVLGAALATGLSTILQVIFLNIYYSKKIGIKVLYLFYKAFKGILLYQILGAIIGFLIDYLLIDGLIVGFICGGFAYVIIAFGGFILLGKSKEEKILIKNLVLKLKRKIVGEKK